MGEPKCPTCHDYGYIDEPVPCPDCKAATPEEPVVKKDSKPLTGKELFQKAAKLLRAGMTKEELVAFGDALDNDPAALSFAGAVDAELIRVAPEVFGVAPGEEE